MVISWLPPLISQRFSPNKAFKDRMHYFLQFALVVFTWISLHFVPYKRSFSWAWVFFTFPFSVDLKFTWKCLSFCNVNNMLVLLYSHQCQLNWLASYTRTNLKFSAICIVTTFYVPCNSILLLSLKHSKISYTVQC